ncbi:hypothetical protein GCU67_03360 [Modestobacter muralis]|uniref:Uncharacterized protein n=1 Tax=Modestobacter muralis TaxID=1608614 RepID=A0A6P0EV81_9ACTN|nr:hypothetical protein [Modestobacter muralis]NEK93218.1 hypothetical protein [Modestobacter muralis]NEN49985.1 hypothetical protein [Modestobacter muralis]
MSTSGPGIFDDDLACDVRDHYRRSLEDRVPDAEATRRIVEGVEDLLPDEEPVLWLALGATQSRFGRLDDDVRRRALDVIDSGHDVARWAELRPELGAARGAALAALREQLTGPQPPRRAVRRPWREITDLEPGTALAWRASNGVIAVLRVVQVWEDEFTQARHPVLERLAWAGHVVPSADVVAQLPAAGDDGRWRPEGGAGPYHRPGVYLPVRLRKRDPDRHDSGFTVCGHVPARPGDDADWSLGASGVHWGGLSYLLELAAAAELPET